MDGYVVVPREKSLSLVYLIANLCCMLAPEKHSPAIESLVKKMIAVGACNAKILEQLVFEAQTFVKEGEVCSILLLDEDGLLRNGASPGLPDDYLNAIDGIKPDPNFGTCAAAAATGNIVITSDFFSDNRWPELRHLPLALGYLGAWSNPIKSADGKILGTFGTYFRSNRVPSSEEIEHIQLLSCLAAKIVEGTPTL